MTLRPFRFVPLLVGIVALCAPAPVRGENRTSAGVKWVEGSRAARDTWTQDDGCPARTGATETELLTGPREVAWKFNAPGEIEGEPLAWMARTYVVERVGNKHTVHVLATATGVERAKQTFDSPLPLAPCVGEGRILLRSSPRTIQGFGLGEKGLVSRWTLTAKSSVGPPCLVHDEVYVVVDGVLQRFGYGVSTPVWPKAGGAAPVKVAGGAVAGAAPAAKGAAPGGATEYCRPSVRGGSVYVATGDQLVEVDRKDGSVLRQGKLAVAVEPRAARVLVGFVDVLVATGKKFPAGDHDADTARFLHTEAGPYEVGEGLGLPYGVASFGRDWAGAAVKKAGTLAFMLLRPSDRILGDESTLATSALRAEFLELKAPPTTSGNLVDVGGRVFDGDTLDVLRFDGVPAVSRVVPLRDRMLVVETKNRVTAWKSARKVADVAPLDLLTPPGSTVPDLAHAYAVVEEGRVVAGGLTFDPKTATLKGPGKSPDAGPWPLAAVRVLLTDDAPPRLLAAARPDAAAEGVIAVARARAGAEILTLVAPAVAAGDAALARRVHTAAAERGAPSADLATAEKAVLALEAKPGARAEDKAAEVEARLATLTGGSESDLLVEVASALPPAAPIPFGTALVRAAVDRSPYHSASTEWVRSHLPAGLEPKGFQDLHEWLDFIDTYAGASVRVLGPKGKAPTDVPAAVTEALAEARKKWRPDLVGFLNGPLLVVSPPEHPEAIARCLTLGRVVVEELDRAFASAAPPRKLDEILVLHLFPNKSDYLAQSRDGGDDAGGGFGGLESTAGHFSPSANVTRIFFPAGESATGILGTYAHELTHHWIGRRRPPRAGEEELGDRAGGPGYFIVEGFAEFVRGFDFDVAAGKGEPQNPRCEYANVVAACPEAELIPWQKILTMPQREAYAMSHSDGAKVSRRWHLGPADTYSKVLLYYNQSAAVSGYLFLADGGKYRAALLSYLYDHYAGKCDPDALLKAIGMTVDELGKNIVAWCKTVVTAAPPK